MKARFWSVAGLCLCVAVALFGTGGGCGGNDDSSTPTVTGTNVEETVSVPQTLASDTKTVTAGGAAVNSGALTAPGAGKIVAVVSWSEAAQLTVYFKKSGAENYGWVHGDSPLTSTVDPVAEGEACTMYMANSGAVDINASYTITYDPD